MKKIGVFILSLLLAACSGEVQDQQDGGDDGYDGEEYQGDDGGTADYDYDHDHDNDHDNESGDEGCVDVCPFTNGITWDVINEPEWAMTGTSPYGDEDYTPNGELDAVTHAEMETFVSEIITVLREESSALITVGAAAFKWANAWKNVDIDFYQFHMYSWVNDWWPYTNPPSHYGLDDKPLVMGEFPMGDLAAGIPYSDVILSWYQNGYAGALSWQYNEAGAQEKANLKSFADLHPCETSY